MRYRKQKDIKDSERGNGASWVVGMLFVVEIRMRSSTTGEKVKQRLLLVGTEAHDIERKIKWIVDTSKYDEFSICSVEKVREKVHVLSTVITQDDSSVGPIVKTDDRVQCVAQGKTNIEKYEAKLFAVGITTTMIAKDESHAMRKVGNAIIASTQDFKSQTAASLSDGSTVSIEEIPFSSGFASPRDVSSEINRAHFVRG